MNRPLTSECKSYLRIDNLTEAECRNTIESFLTPHSTLEKALITKDQVPATHFKGTIFGDLSMSERGSHLTKGARGRAFSYTELERYAFHSCTLGIPCREGARAALATALLLSRYNSTHEQAHELTARITAETFSELCDTYNLTRDTTEAIFDDNATTALFTLLALLSQDTPHSILSFCDTGRLIHPVLEGTPPFGCKANFEAAVDIWENKKVDSLIKPQGHFTGRIHRIHTYLPQRATHEQLLEQVRCQLEAHTISLAIIPTITSSGYRVPFSDVARILRSHPNGENAILILDDCQGIGRLNLTTGKSILEEDGDLLWKHFDGVFLTGGKVLGALLGSGAILWQRARLKNRLKPFKQSSIRQRHRTWSFWSTDINRVLHWNQSARTGGMAQAPELASLLASLRRLRTITNAAWEKSSLSTELLGLLSTSNTLIAHSATTHDTNQCDSIFTFSPHDEKRWLEAKRRLLHEPPASVENSDGIERISLPAHLTVNGVSLARFAINPLTLREEDDYAMRARQTLIRLLELL